MGRLIKQSEKEKKFFYTEEELNIKEENNIFIDKDEYVKIKDKDKIDNRSLSIFLTTWLEGSEHFLVDENSPITIGERWKEVIEYAMEKYPKVVYEGEGYRFINLPGIEIEQYIPGVKFVGDNNYKGQLIIYENFPSEEELLEKIKDTFINNYGVYQSFSRDKNWEWGGSSAGILLKITANVRGLDFSALEDILNGQEPQEYEYDNEVIAPLPNDIHVEIVGINNILEDKRNK